MYKVTRLPLEYIGTFNHFSSVEYIVTEDGAPANNVGKWPPKIGEGFIARGNITNCDRCYPWWQSTEVQEVVELTEDKCIFKTRNSEYLIEIIT